MRNVPIIDLKECNLYELNYLAELIDQFDYDKEQCFLGGYHIHEKNMTVEKAVNLAMNIEQEGVGYFQPARDPRELAEFYLEYNLIDELKDVPDEGYLWIVDHINLEALGEEIRESENGTFVGDGYVTIGELKELYDGSFRVPEREPYIFQLEVGLHPNKDEGCRYLLQLPLSNKELEHMKSVLKVDDLSQLTCYQFQSIVPLLEPMDFEMEDMDTLHQIATSIAHLKEKGELMIYKALVDALDIIELEGVSKLGEQVDSFELKEGIRNYFDYGKSKLQGGIEEELIGSVDIADYGLKIAGKEGVSMTSYGALVPKDGVALLERISQSNEVESKPLLFGEMMF